MRYVEKREFIQYTSKVLKKGVPFTVTSRGMPEYLVSESDEKEKVVAIKTVKDIPGFIREEKVAYGCGCKMKEGRKLCPAHNRI